jgi:hypothetical protein
MQTFLSLHQAPIPGRSSVSSPTSAERVDSVESTVNLEERCDEDFQDNSAASPLLEAATCHAAVDDEGFTALEVGRLPQVGGRFPSPTPCRFHGMLTMT